MMATNFKAFRATSNKNLDPGAPQGLSVTDPEEMIVKTDEYQALYGGEQEGMFGRHQPRDSDNKKVILVHGTNGEFFARHGLIGTVVKAYNTHHNLQLRPDDFWITILTQFCAYVNGRAEELRSKFVAHEGKKELVVEGIGNIYTADFALLTRKMLDEISKNIKDSSLREWFLPGFSTTTKTDEVCAAATTMCCFKKYFDYKMMLSCGIPQVTLLGTVEDWCLLRTKIERLLEFDNQEKLLSKWVSLLRVVCDNLIESAKNGSESNLEFWDTVCHRSGGGSGPSYLSGWITTFSFFNEKGSPIGSTMRRGSEQVGEWLTIEYDDINPNVVTCPVKIDDNGVLYTSRLFVGQMTYDCDEEEMIDGVKRMKLRPRNDWALAVEGESG